MKIKKLKEEIQFIYHC